MARWAPAREEMGWAPVETLDPDRIHAGPWLHWHGDVFSVPADAQLLARTARELQRTRPLVQSLVDDFITRAGLGP